MDGERHDVPEGTAPWIRFNGETADNGTVTGYDGCNHFTAGARIAGGTVTLDAE